MVFEGSASTKVASVRLISLSSLCDKSSLCGIRMGMLIPKDSEAVLNFTGS